MKNQGKFSPFTKGMFEGRVRRADLRVLARSGLRSGVCRPYEGRIGLGLRKIYLSTLITRPSIRPDPQYNEIYNASPKKN